MQIWIFPGAHMYEGTFSDFVFANECIGNTFDRSLLPKRIKILFSRTVHSLTKVIAVWFQCPWIL